jgi:hypothetical protein
MTFQRVGWVERSETHHLFAPQEQLSLTKTSFIFARVAGPVESIDVAGRLGSALARPQLLCGQALDAGEKAIVAAGPQPTPTYLISRFVKGKRPSNAVAQHRLRYAD